MFTAKELANAALEVAQNHKTLYVLGCIGAPLTVSNQNRALNAQSYNRQAARKKKIQAADGNTFGFDCVCMIKSILWGWKGDSQKSYGGAVYKSNGVPDVNADGMIALCKNVSKDFSTIQIGEAVWMKGHIGVYIGNGLAVECTPKWKDGVQVTAVHNIGKKAGYNGRSWVKHGMLPWVSYGKPKLMPAQTRTPGLAGTYRVDSAIGLKLRTGPSTSYPILETMANGSKVRSYGYHTGDWYFVVSATGQEGFCHKGYLQEATL